MKKKRIASKLLSLLLCAAVIVSSSFSGITLVDVSATQAADQETVTVSQNTAEDVAGDDATVSENDADDAEEEIVEEEVVEEEVVEEETVEEEETAEKPWEGQTSAAEKISGAEKKESTGPQPYVPAEKYASRNVNKDTTGETGGVFDFTGDNNFGTLSFNGGESVYVYGEGVAEEGRGADEVAPERVVADVDDSVLVGKLMGEKQLAQALLEIYNEDYNGGTDLILSQFTYAELKTMTGVVDLSQTTVKSDVKTASGLGYLKATEINLSGTGITYIPKTEFSGNKTLQTITLPDTLVGFGDSAFKDCTALVNIHSSAALNTLPSGLRSTDPEDESVLIMGSGIFSGCTSLEQIAIPSFTVDSNALIHATEMFRGCSKLWKVDIGANVAVIPDSCFYNAGDSTKAITLTIAEGSKLNTILDKAFQWCNIAEIDLSHCSGLKQIGKLAFTPKKNPYKKTETAEATVKLRKVILPESNSTIKANGLQIGEGAFIFAPVSAMCVGTYSAQKEGKVVLPNYVTTVGEAAFYGNSAMTSLQLSANTPVINKFTFAECKELINVTLDVASNGNTCATKGIANQAFYNDAKLANANFLAQMNKLTYIGEEAYEVDNAEDEITYIDFYAYKDNKLNAKDLHASAVFTGTAIASAQFPASLRTIGSCAFGNANSLATVTWAKDANLAAGQVYTIGTDAFWGCSELRDFVYPDTGSVKAKFLIKSRAFVNCSSLVYFSSKAVSVDDTTEAMTNNVLPASLTELGFAAFGACGSLEYMKIKNNVYGKSPVIGQSVFMICRNLKTVEMPKATKVIPERMFYDCGLTSFPTFAGGTALEEIKYGAFFGNKIEEVDLSAHTKLNYIGVIAFAYHDPYEDQEDEDGNEVEVVADEVLYKKIVNDQEVNMVETDRAPLTTLILPDGVKGSYINMVWDDNMLQAAGSFTTLKTELKGKDGEVFIPEYIICSKTGDSVFAGTAVTKAVWEYTTQTTVINRWNAIPRGMFAMTPITTMEQCCIPAGDLEYIGAMAYMGTQITALDLTKYPRLKESGDGSFAYCPKLASVKFPKNGMYTRVSDAMFMVGNFANTIGLVIIDEDAELGSVLKTVDFGTVTAIGDFAFATIDTITSDEIKEEENYVDALEKVDLRGTKVTEIGNGAFAGNLLLTDLHLGSVKTIGDLAFCFCENLDLTYDAAAGETNPLPNTVTSIGEYAFADCFNIGKVEFGSNLTKIGKYAFASCALHDPDTMDMLDGRGLTRVDFTKAKNLIEIGEGAFFRTAIKNFDISASPVVELKKEVVSNCPLLETIKLGESVRGIAQNAAYGCINLKSLDFYSTTTINLKAFYDKSDYYRLDDQANRIEITPIDTMDFHLTSVVLNVGLGNPMMFPYYVNDKKNEGNTGEFGAIIIGQPMEGSGQSDVHKYVKVMANTTQYYRNNTNNRITDSKYFEKTGATEYAVNGTTVYTFKIQGLKATPANETIPFSVTCGYKFKAAGDVEEERRLTAKYNLKVMDIPYYPTFYTDQARLYPYKDMKVNQTTGVTTGSTNIRVGEKNVTGKVTLYYDITPLKKTNWRPKTGNLIVKTSNPDVVTFATGSGMKKVDDKTFRMVAEPGSKEAELTTVTKGKKIVLTPKKKGSAVVTIYHEDCPSKKVTWNVKIDVDIKSITMSPPSQFSKGVYEGDEIPIVNTITFYVGGTVSRTKDTLKDYKKYTDNTITYKSSNTSIATINSSGLIKIKKVPKTTTVVNFMAYANRPDGTKKEFVIPLQIVYPPFKVNKIARSSKGEQVKIVKAASGKKAAEVCYMAPANPSATSVTIPSTMTVGGIKCKVTSIAAGAFEGNKKLKSVVIGKYVTKIPKNAFKGCKKLTKVTFKGKVTEIGESAFEKCTALKKITIPKTVTKIGKKAFAGCKKLTTVTFKTKSKLKEIGESAFQSCKSMKTIKIPSTYLTKIGVKAFYKCSKLKKIVVKSKKVTFVGKDAFKGIYKKAVIDVPGSVLSKYKTLFNKGQGKKVKIK